jgi:hypothetical protein
LLASFVALVLLSKKHTLIFLAKVWPVLAMCVAVMGVYLLVHVENRFVGGCVVLLWIALFSSFRVSSRLAGFAGYILLGISIVLIITVVRNTALAVRDNGPYSALQDVALSDQLDNMGIHDSRIAIIGGGGIYAVRLSHTKIVAEITDWDRTEFWRLTSDARSEIYQQFANCRASFLLATDPGAATLDTGWTKVRGVPFYVRRLRNDSSPSPAINFPGR